MITATWVENRGNGTVPAPLPVIRSNEDDTVNRRTLQDLRRTRYPEQFAPVPDPLHIAIPRDEILLEMVTRGEDVTLDRVCTAVAVVLDALAGAAEDEAP